MLDARASDPNVGSSQSSSKNNASLSTLLSTLFPVLLYAVIYLVIFLVLRRKFPRKYFPRTFLKSLRPEERSPAVSNSLYGWFSEFWNIPDSYILIHHSIDGFLLLRLLKQAVVGCVVGMVITWPILFPVNATGGGGGKAFNAINMGNVTNNYYRFFAHTGCAYLFFGYLLFMIARESIYYINLRQAYLLSPIYSSRLSSRTVLFTSVPDEFLDEKKLRYILGETVVKRVWVATNTKELDDLVSQRDKLALKLEGGETKLIRKANKARLKAEKEEAKANGTSNGDSNGHSKSNATATATGAEVENGLGPASTNSAKWLNPKDRPTHKLGKFGLYGKKVDTIDYCRVELAKLIPEVQTKQAEHRNGTAAKVNSVFVEFTTLAEAQAAYQSLTHHQVLHMAPRFTGMTPGEIIWSNLRIKWWERVVRVLATTAFVTALVIFWSIPVAFVGAISNVQSLANSGKPYFAWLKFINDIPPAILGVVTGLLPTILLAVLMALLPIVLRLMAKLSGDPTLSAVELSTQNYYFAFQIVQVFLVATLGSAAASALGQILASPTGIPGLLAKSIPKASNFYLSYFVLQGLGVVASMLLQLVGLIIFLVLSKLLDNTPRKVYKRWITLAGIGWGTVYPIFTNLFCIAICYAIIAPFVLLFAAIGLFLFYIAFRYNLLFVTNASIDTKGRVYPQALQHLFIGIYVAQFSLIGLFAIASGESVGAVGPLILMIFLIIFTALFHMSLNTALRPLIDYLPKSLEAEERRLLEEEKLSEEKGMNRESSLGQAPHKLPGVLTKFMKPHIYNDYHTMRRLVPRDIEVRYEEGVEDNAYYNPSISSDVTTLWIPRDSMGISTQEIRDTPKEITMTDVEASLDEKNNIKWDTEASNEAPIYEKPVYY